jgi:hypothetical protein
LANSKVETFLGFCIRSRKITFGLDGIEKLTKNVFLLVVSSTLSENSLKKAIKLKDKFQCPIILCNVDLASVLHKEGCKAVAIQDKNLANAILENADENFQVYLGGNI